MKMTFWQEHKTLRMILMLVFFIGGLVMLYQGWAMTGELKGLGIELLGVASVLFTLWLYNKPYVG